MSFRESLYHFASRYLDAFLPETNPVIRNTNSHRQLRILMGVGTIFVILAVTRLPFVLSEGGRRLIQNLIVIACFGSVLAWTVWQKARYLKAVSSLLVLISIAHNIYDSYAFPFYPGHNVPFAFAIILATHLVFGRWMSMLVLIILTGMYLPLVGSTWPADPDTRNLHVVAYQLNFANNTIMAALLVWLISEAYDHFREESEQKLILLNRERENDLELAQNLHRELFPSSGRYGNCRFAAISRPVATVGGDYCEALRTGAGSWFAVGDVSGHGLQAGMLVMQIRAMFVYLLSNHPDFRPSLLFAELNNIFFEIVKKLNIRSYMTFFALRVSDNGQVVGVGSHEKVLVMRRRESLIEVLPTQGIWLGLDKIEGDGGRVAELKFTLQPGDCVLLYTDGLTETRNPGGEAFGLERVVACLREDLRISGVADERGIVRSLLDALDEFRGKAPPDDDLTVACICMDSIPSSEE